MGVGSSSFSHWALVAGAYLLGGVPFGLILARLAAGVDVRRSGSGNIGATNVTRVAGKKVGAATLVLDAAKGFVPVEVGRRLGLGPEWLGAAALAAVVGHCYPVYLRFRGGKGVATTIGALLGLEVWAGLAGLAAWGVGFKLSRISSVGAFSLLGAALVAVLALRGVGATFALVAAIALLVLWRHRENIARLARNEEHRF